jgi:phosphomannomutase
MNFIFDVDGTLTPSRGVMDPDFKEWFLRFIQQHSVMLVTGSDLTKTVEQVGIDIVENVEYCFNCSGNVVMYKGKTIFRRDFSLPDNVKQYLDTQLLESSYPERCGIHFEDRRYMVNFSVVGRGANSEQRTQYYEWDKLNGERIRIATELNQKYPSIQAAVGGETGIDIFGHGHDKAQVSEYLHQNTVFFGDRMDPNGNDYTLARTVVDNGLGRCYNVINWTETMKELLRLCPNV